MNKFNSYCHDICSVVHLVKCYVSLDVLCIFGPCCCCLFLNIGLSIVIFFSFATANFWSYVCVFVYHCCFSCRSKRNHWHMVNYNLVISGSFLWTCKIRMNGPPSRDQWTEKFLRSCPVLPKKIESDPVLIRYFLKLLLVQSRPDPPMYNHAF